MSRKKEERDQSILRALSGHDDLRSSCMQIEDNYLLREKMENRREQGFWVSKKWLPEPRTELEIAIFKADKAMEEIEGERINRPMVEYPGQEEEPMEKKESTIALFDLKGDNKVVIRIGEHTLTLEKHVRWVPNVRGEIEKSWVIGHIRTNEGREMKLIFGASGNIWVGQAKEELIQDKEQVVTV